MDDFDAMYEKYLKEAEVIPNHQIQKIGLVRRRNRSILGEV